MSKRMFCLLALAATIWPAIGVAQDQAWNVPGATNEQLKAPSSGTAPRRDLTGIWDAGGAGIGGSGQADEREKARAPFTKLGEEMYLRNKPGNGPRTAAVAEIGDPLSTIGDPSGFPRLLTFELRPFQVVQTPTQVLMLYMFEKRWRVIWTDGRQLPANPDPRWYGYSVGRWEDDYTFVINSNGTDERTWLDNAGNPHSDQLKVEERYHRVDRNTMELTVIIDDPKAYTRSWTARDKLKLTVVPSSTDLMEMIPSASEAAAVKSIYAAEAAGTKK
jgi:hypothetical protein